MAVFSTFPGWLPLAVWSVGDSVIPCPSLSVFSVSRFPFFSPIMDGPPPLNPWGPWSVVKFRRFDPCLIFKANSSLRFSPATRGGICSCLLGDLQLPSGSVCCRLQVNQSCQPQRVRSGPALVCSFPLGPFAVASQVGQTYKITYSNLTKPNLAVIRTYRDPYWYCIRINQR